LENDLSKLPNFTVIVVAVKDEASRKLSSTAKQFFEKMGSKEISRLGFR